MAVPIVRTSITLSARDLGHFASAFAAAFVTEWQAGGFSIHRSALYSLAPAAATVAFRQVFKPKAPPTTLPVSVQLPTITVTKRSA